jgi:hypothetical protein
MLISSNLGITLVEFEWWETVWWFLISYEKCKHVNPTQHSHYDTLSDCFGFSYQTVWTQQTWRDLCVTKTLENIRLTFFLVINDKKFDLLNFLFVRTFKNETFS